MPFPASEVSSLQQLQEVDPLRTTGKTGRLPQRAAPLRTPAEMAFQDSQSTPEASDCVKRKLPYTYNKIQFITYAENGPKEQNQD